VQLIPFGFGRATIPGSQRAIVTSCWIASFKEDKVREILEIPEDVRVVAMTPLGYLDEAPEMTPRKNIEELIRYDRYQ